MGSYTEPYAKFVGHQIREARLAAGLSHNKLVAAAGMPVAGGRSHLIKLENGKHLPRPETLEKIAAATGKPISFFVPTIPSPRSRRQRSYRDAIDEYLARQAA